MYRLTLEKFEDEIKKYKVDAKIIIKIQWINVNSSFRNSIIKESIIISIKIVFEIKIFLSTITFNFEDKIFKL